jgi:hypothetical protein
MSIEITIRSPLHKRRTITRPTVVELEEKLGSALKLNLALKRLADALIDQTGKRKPHIVAVQFHRVEFSFVYDTEEDEK